MHRMNHTFNHPNSLFTPPDFSPAIHDQLAQKSKVIFVINFRFLRPFAAFSGIFSGKM